MKAMKILLGALVVLMAVGGIAMAAGSGTTTIAADLGTFIEVTAPADPTGTWNLGYGDNLKTLSGLVIDSNSNAWTLSASEAGGLVDPIKMNIHGEDYKYYGTNHKVGTDYLPLSALVAEGVARGTFTTDVNLNQPVTGLDAPATYNIQISFMGMA